MKIKSSFVQFVHWCDHMEHNGNSQTWTNSSQAGDC